jgi:hypothetical protein
MYIFVSRAKLYDGCCSLEVTNITELGNETSAKDSGPRSQRDALVVKKIVSLL